MADKPADRPLPALSMMQGAAMLVGIVVGIGIFKTPSIVAANAGGEAEFIALWLLGGALTVVGALCYAELGSAYPHTGGEYHFLRRAYGLPVGFLFAWGRTTVMQTGAIAAVAFAYGDYANALLPLGSYGPALHAASTVALLTGMQLLGTDMSGRSQLILTGLTIAALLIVAISGYSAGQPDATPAQTGLQAGSAGLAMVFVLLTYGGWNETAYLSGELSDVRRNMVRVLLVGASVVTALYVLVNTALLSFYGLERLAGAHTLVAEPIQAAFGSGAALVVGFVVCVSALSTLNATIFTGARSTSALGEELPVLGGLSERSGRTGAPVKALLLQAAITFALIALGAQARDGFTAMVEYTAPVFWAFLFLIGMSLFVFRRREPDRARPFRVPLYPLTPLVFCATALWLLHASLAYTGAGALVGVVILAAGVPVYLLARPAAKAQETPAR